MMIPKPESQVEKHETIDQKELPHVVMQNTSVSMNKTQETFKHKEKKLLDMFDDGNHKLLNEKIPENDIASEKDAM